MVKKKKKVVLAIRRGIKTSYKVLSAENCLSPEPGAWIDRAEAQSLVDDGYSVVVKEEK